MDGTIYYGLDEAKKEEYLRDFFAINAPANIMVQNAISEDSLIEKLVDFRYRFADAMLKRRREAIKRD